MSAESKIEWTDATWNPLLGCDKCSAGCQHCYAIRTAWRMQHNPHPAVATAYAGLVAQRADGSLNWTGRINLIPERLREPMRWARPRRIFVNSQSDLFHDDVPDAFIDHVFAVMAYCQPHTFQVLTKRPARMRAYVEQLENAAAMWRASDLCKKPGFNPTDILLAMEIAGSGEKASTSVHPWPLPNVQLGTSVENQEVLVPRVLELLATPAAVRFLSCEPLLGAVDPGAATWSQGAGLFGDCLSAHHIPDGDKRPFSTIHWVIAGGESGPGARPMHPDWARSLRDQCVSAGVPFFFKQWGEWVPFSQIPDETLAAVDLEEYEMDSLGGHSIHRLGKKAAGRLLDGREWNEMPEVRQC